MLPSETHQLKGEMIRDFFPASLTLNFRNHAINLIRDLIIKFLCWMPIFLTSLNICMSFTLVYKSILWLHDIFPSISIFGHGIFALWLRSALCQIELNKWVQWEEAILPCKKIVRVKIKIKYHKQRIIR